MTMQPDAVHAFPTGAVLAEIVNSHSKLEPRPSAQETERAHLAIAEIDKKLIVDLEELLMAPCPEHMDAAQFRSLQGLKEERLRKDADIQKAKHNAVISLENEHKHYSELKHQAEKVLMNGVQAQTSGGRSPPSAISGKPPPTTKLFGMSEIHPVDSVEGGQEAPVEKETQLLPRQGEIEQVVEKAPGMFKSHGKFSSTMATISQVTVGQKLLPIEEDGGFRIVDLPSELLTLVEEAFESESHQLNISQMFSHKLGKVPSSICDIVSLRVLNMSEQQLTVVPDMLGNLSNLVDLDLHANKIKELPDSLGLLNRLVKLNLHSNCLEELPVTIGGCKKLQELIVNFNQLKNLPESIGKLHELRILRVQLNRIKRLPATIGDLSALEELDAHFNQMNYIPDSICMLKRLKNLDLGSNFHELKRLPAAMGTLESLETLNLAFNNIKVLPESLGNLSSLKTLNLEGNPLVVPPMAFADKGTQEVLEFLRQRQKERAEKAAEKPSFLRRFLKFAMCGPGQDEADLDWKERGSLRRDLNTYA